MSQEQPSVFLERRAYRQRRMADAARMLPVFGVVLFYLPLLWAISGGQGRATTYVMSFLFLAWLVLLIAAALISSRLPSGAETDDAFKDE